MTAPPEVVELVERFDRYVDAYKRGKYNETQVRREFVDPLFQALGWDVDNTQGYAEAYKEVVHEDAIRVGHATKAPDYGFRIGGVRKFFVEAKKPSVSIKEDTHPAYQLRRYAWSAKLPLSILTDFEEFAVYDCRIRPAKGDGPSTARTLYLTYQDYADRWDDIAGVFSRQAILTGSFDKYVESKKAKRGTAQVDTAFLQEIQRWRELLARNIALRNAELSQRELNFAVQRTIDRIIFLRITEDRGIEPYGRLMALQNGTQVYQRLCQLFHQADDRYNSGLFYFRPEKGRSDEGLDRLTTNLVIDDRVLKDIFQNLYYPDSPYEFSVLPADILGQVYEQFLGQVIRLTAGHQAKVEEKPEVKKAGGVYYTPTYIVDYIVKQTVGQLVAGKNPGPKGAVSHLKILDPACGSGSFLLGAYQFLLDWHLEAYQEEGNKWSKGRTPRIYQTAPGEWRLTTDERKRILLNNIYGVDIDAQAVEVTKLSLLLKVLEEENSQTLATQLMMFQERALPDLGNNIKCGNSLIGPDFYQGQQLALLDEEEQYRINVFDWMTEFPQIMKAGGFDAVIGNPPYIRMEGFKGLKNYLKAKYASHDERSDLYVYFAEQSHRLLNSHGRFGMIVSNKFLRANYGKPLRNFLSKHARINRIVDFAGLPVFAGATVRTVVLLTSRDRGSPLPAFYSPPPSPDTFSAIAAGSLSVERAAEQNMYEISDSQLAQSWWSFVTKQERELLDKLQVRCQPLGQYCDGRICMGIKSGLTKAFVIDENARTDILRSNPEAEVIIKPFLNGRDVRRYCVKPKNAYLIYTYHGVDIKRYPAVEQHLRHFKERLKRRATRQEWYELQQPQLKFKQYLDGPKIIFPDIAKTPRFVLDDKGYYGSNTIYFIPRHDMYLLGLLNSRLGLFYLSKTCAGLEGKTDTYLRLFGQYLAGFPIRTIGFDDPTDKAYHDQMVALVERMLDLHQQQPQAPQAKTILKRQIEATDREIDSLVYRLYDLTEDEIAVVEEE